MKIIDQFFSHYLAARQECLKKLNFAALINCIMGILSLLCLILMFSLLFSLVMLLLLFCLLLLLLFLIETTIFFVTLNCCFFNSKMLEISLKEWILYLLVTDILMGGRGRISPITIKSSVNCDCIRKLKLQ